MIFKYNNILLIKYKQSKRVTVKLKTITFTGLHVSNLIQVLKEYDGVKHVYECSIAPLWQSCDETT